MATLLIFSILFSVATPLQAYQDTPAPESASEANTSSTKAESNSGLARFERGVDQLFG
ncbi:MAG TPA: alanine glycine permease, partial [Planctomycetaceae bacterium]|nr:alanine glycine permease [Planctomycetaceae bacterium]